MKHTLETYSVNRVLQVADPEINKEEINLPRETRTQLSRLRSGFSRTLKSYMSRIEEDIIDECPNCNATPHDTTHLFNCPSTPTTLTPLDLWTNPRNCAKFLKLLPEGWDDGPAPAEDPG